MSERWKPKHGEVYYCVTIIDAVYSHVWCDGPLDSSYYKSGNCFKTKAKAEAAAEKVKALLLNLHEPTKDRNQLPKLTAEVFNRPECPEWACYAVVDIDGNGWYFEQQPIRMSEGRWTSAYQYRRQVITCAVFDAEDWQNSMTKRPSKLPDWCKVGAWVFNKRSPEGKKYQRIEKIDPRYPDVAQSSGDFITPNMLNLAVFPVRIRPYNADELRSLVGKVIDTDYGAAFLVTACGNSHITVGISNSLQYSAYDLLDERYTIDGNPCGVLEHLNEKGEWVK